MMSFIDHLNKLLGDPTDKELRKLWPIVAQVKQSLEKCQSLEARDLPKKTEEFRRRVADGESLDAILPEAFAIAMRGCQLLLGKKIVIGKMEQTWDMVPFDVQILGGIVLHRGAIAEMRTGEGKTLVCTMPVYLNALTGKGVHVVTVNDYLAKRDAQWMGHLYEILGLSAGIIVHEKDTSERKQAYGSDIAYGTNNEFGFDYLRDNMTPALAAQVQRGLYYAIVDEVDSILIDEARTPLIISQPAGESTEKYRQYASLVRQLARDQHYTIDEKQRVAVLTEEGIKKMEGLLGVENIYTERGFEEVHHIEQALRSHAVYKLDVDYVIREGEIIIVDEFTGRLMPGRRYGHGLHQAIEAKEGVQVQRESKTLATITFQNYFRLYEKLAGMTGTAKTEEEEFEQIYHLRVYVIPTHRSMIRGDKPDAIYRTVAAKFKAVAAIAQEKHSKGQPVLVGTTSIEKSEAMSALLTTMQVPHNILNAKHHEREAEVVALAGQRDAVTIATNMAGRGTDIKLGAGVVELGGLCILGTERHEARRIDNQLRGRAGRQGDPGESQFFVSMEDELMRLFGGDRLKGMMEKLNVPEDVPLENTMVSRAIENAQKKVEGHNFDIRKHVVQYDDVMNKHREIIYKRRQRILERLAETTLRPSGFAGQAEGLHAEILKFIEEDIGTLASAHTPSIDQEEWKLEELWKILSAFHPTLGKQVLLTKLQEFREAESLQQYLKDLAVKFYEEKCGTYEKGITEQAERIVTLRAIDTHWMDHIDTMAHLREQVAFAGYAQRDPLIEYKDQGFRLFKQLLVSIQSTVVLALFQVDFAQFAPRILIEQALQEQEGLETNIDEIEAELTETGAASAFQKTQTRHAEPISGRHGELVEPRSTSGGAIAKSRTAEKVGRNDPCPCGSGKKFKKCHGTFA